MKKYLTVQEAATSLSIALNRGVHPRDIADLAREKTVTPVVFFEGFIGDFFSPDPEKYLNPEPFFSGQKFSGYLHSSKMKGMIDCIAREQLCLLTIYEFIEKRTNAEYFEGDDVFACNLSRSESDEDFPYFSTSDIRIPSIEVECIIEKHRNAIAERQSKKGLPLELPTQPVTTAEPITTLQAIGIMAELLALEDGCYKYRKGESNVNAKAISVAVSNRAKARFGDDIRGFDSFNKKISEGLKALEKIEKN